MTDPTGATTAASHHSSSTSDSVDLVSGGCHGDENHESVTQLPVLQADGQPAIETTPIPGSPMSTPTADSTKELPKSSSTTSTNKKKLGGGRDRRGTPSQSLSNVSEDTSALTDEDRHNNIYNDNPGLAAAMSETEDEDANGMNQDHIKKVPPKKSEALATSQVTPAMSGNQVAKDESRFRKVATRIISGAGMLGVFAGCVYTGHIYVCMIVAVVQALLFRELVRVRYHVYYLTIVNTIPLFRTTQWMWFAVAIFYTYQDFLVEIITNNQQLHYLLHYAQYASIVAFTLYSVTFVTTIATMQVGHIKFQLNQLCWTIVVLCLTVGQMKYIMHNIFNGLYWFTLPFLLVVTNDIMAYVSGITCGRKFIHRKFISFSPNKTWEGFLGGAIFTIWFSWYLSRFLAQWTWMTCPTNEFRIFPQTMRCDMDPIFLQAQSIFPPQIFELFPSSFVKMIPNIVEICSVRAAPVAASLASEFGTDAATTGSSSGSGAAVVAEAAKIVLTRCISGEPTHESHHFELVLKNVYPVQIHALWLALFASVVAPFGGFL
jgi:phosphatidate cytidylyltransferase